MRTIYIIVEGQTEEEFVNSSLSHYFKDTFNGLGINDIETKPILLETSPGFFGGDLSFARYEINVRTLLNTDPNGIVSSLIDFYQLRQDFPGYLASLGIVDKNQRVEFLEQQVESTIVDSRFIPYIQLHEFEGLLFSDIRGFDYINNITAINKLEIITTIAANPNPELINDGLTTAPSKRLMRLIPRYKKTFHGPIIALENGMPPVLAKCTRFAGWISKIINKINPPPAPVAIQP